MYQQRAEPEAMDVRGPWVPEIRREGAEPVEVAPEPGDRYAVVDEIIGGDVRLAVTTWPEVDEAGRLRFTEGSEPVDVEGTALQGKVDAERTREGQLVRPLRIGDVFLVRGFGPVASWDRVLDITASSRRAAKHAGLRAVAQPEVGQATAETREEPSWRRPPKGPGSRRERPPAELTPPSVANAAI